MNRRRMLYHSANLFAALGLPSCGLLGGGGRYRFRMTVEVETLQGRKSGSSVFQVTAGYRPDLQPGGKAREWKVRGEAVAVDLPDGKTLFALLKTFAIYNDLVGMSMTALDPAFRNDVPESANRIANGKGNQGQVEILQSDLPLLVAFGDIEDPATVFEVKADDFSAHFGIGTKLKIIYVENTNQGLKTGIQKRLRWLPKYRSKLLSGERFESISPRLSDHLGAGDFSTELS